MLNELLNNIDIIGISLAFILIAGFIIFKTTQKTSQNEIVEDELDIPVAEKETSFVQDEYDESQTAVGEINEIVEQTDHVKEEPLEEMGSEEGDFGVVEEEITPQPETAKIRKRDVAPHGKITKENFKEFAGQRILLAEDNLINQKVILGLLADSGIEVVIANDGAEALSILQNDTNFLLVLMDAHMPNIDGFEATRRIRANSDYDHILVVALSGDTAADDIKKMTEAGMSEHLEKPLRMDALYDIFYAYSSETDELNEEDMISVVSTRELDGEKGLEICGGDEKFYHEILSEFLTTYHDSDQKLLEMVETNKMEEAAQLLLDIIGVSANIGALKLNNVAKYIKDCLSDSEEKSCLTLLQQYQHHLKALIEDIKEYQK